METRSNCAAYIRKRGENMAFVMRKQIGPAVIDVYDDCYKGVTIEEAEKIIEDMYNSTSIIRKSGGHVVTRYKGRKKETEDDGTA